MAPGIIVDADPVGRATAAIGLAGVGAAGGPVARRLVASPIDDVQLLPSDSILDSAEISPDGVRKLLDAIASKDSVVIVDVGDIVTTPSAMVWAGVIDGTVVAVRRGSTRRMDLREALARLGRVHATMLGTIFVDPKASRAVGPKPQGSDRSATTTSAAAMAQRQRPDEG